MTHRSALASRPPLVLTLDLDRASQALLDEARATLTELQDGFEPWIARGTALHLWEYRGGPWRSLHVFPLAPVEAPGPRP